MTSHGSSDFDMRFSGHVPILWKRKVRNFIKKDRQQALEVFLEYFKQGKDPNQVKYGLEQLLPDSLNLILSSIEESSPEEKTSLFDLISSPEFLTHLSALNQEKQELIINQIYHNWNTDLNQESIREILSQVDPNLSVLLYNKILKNNSIQIIEILKLWGDNILPIVFESYLKTPIDLIEPLFTELKPEKRVEIFQKTKRLKESLHNIFRLMSPTEEELRYLYASKNIMDQKSRNLILNWLTSQEISHELLLRVYQHTTSEETLALSVDYFITRIKQEAHPIDEIILSILPFKEFLLAHEILTKLSTIKEYQTLNILVFCLNKLQGELTQYSEFFQSEFETYSHQNIELILKTYLDSPYESHHQLLIPFLQDAAAQNWKKLIKAVVGTKTSLPAELVFNIFSNCSKRIKHSIGDFLIEKSLLKQLSFLFSDFDIFHSALVYPKKLPLDVQALLDPFLRQHVSESFEHIIRLGKRITFPQLAFATLMDKSSLKRLLCTVGSRNVLLQFWEETFLLCPEDALEVVLEEYLIKEKKKKDYLVPLLNKLIDLDPLKFWTYLKTLKLQDVTRLEVIITHTFENSIPIIGDVLPRLPEDHLKYIIKDTLPQFNQLGSKILYSLLSIQDISNIEEQVIFSILETVRLNPEDLLVLALVRSSKLINDPVLSKIIPRLSDKLFSLYPTESLGTTDKYRLITLIPIAKTMLSSLSNKELEGTLLPLMNTLGSNVLNSVILNYFLHLSKEGEDLSLVKKLLENYEREEFSIEGKNVFQDYLSIIVGKSRSRDLLIFTAFREKPRGQAQFLPGFLTRTSHPTIEKILLDSPIDPLEENMIKIITNHFESNPPDKPEEYFISLYEKVRGKEDIQRAVLPLLGEYCSWHNLSMLIELPEKEKYQKEYEKALIKFSSRFDIQSHKALHQIWVSGLKDIYNRLKTPVNDTLLQSQCPQCGNPILENQKNCGFCSQRLTCTICRKSVVKLQIEEEVVQCPQCSSFFHRRHLLESVKLQKKCPVCNTALREVEVKSLPVFTFFYK
ncbi:MAG: hypothetical protein ACFFAE_12480 [Candidatus Hodarchaeota archaeon]